MREIAGAVLAFMGRVTLNVSRVLITAALIVRG